MWALPSSAPFVEREYTAEDSTEHPRFSVQGMGSTINCSAATGETSDSIRVLERLKTLPYRLHMIRAQKTDQNPSCNPRKIRERPILQCSLIFHIF